MSNYKRQFVLVRRRSREGEKTMQQTGGRAIFGRPSETKTTERRLAPLLFLSKAGAKSLATGRPVGAQVTQARRPAEECSQPRRERRHRPPLALSRRHRNCVRVARHCHLRRLCNCDCNCKRIPNWQQSSEDCNSHAKSSCQWQSNSGSNSNSLESINKSPTIKLPQLGCTNKAACSPRERHSFGTKLAEIKQKRLERSRAAAAASRSVHQNNGFKNLGKYLNTQWRQLHVQHTKSKQSLIPRVGSISLGSRSRSRSRSFSCSCRGRSANEYDEDGQEDEEDDADDDDRDEREPGERVLMMMPPPQDHHQSNKPSSSCTSREPSLISNFNKQHKQISKNQSDQPGRLVVGQVVRDEKAPQEGERARAGRENVCKISPPGAILQENEAENVSGRFVGDPSGHLRLNDDSHDQQQQQQNQDQITRPPRSRRRIGFITGNRKKIRISILLLAAYHLLYIIISSAIRSRSPLIYPNPQDNPSPLLNALYNNHKPYYKSLSPSPRSPQTGSQEQSSQLASYLINDWSSSSLLFLGVEASETTQPTTRPTWYDTLQSSTNKDTQNSDPPSRNQEHNHHRRHHHRHHHDQNLHYNHLRHHLHHLNDQQSDSASIKQPELHHEPENHRQEKSEQHQFESKATRARRQQPMIYDSQDTDRPIVMTNKGLVRGITQRTVTGKFVDTFLGIPYAQPPVGKYRFRHPQAIQAWQGEWDASKLSNSCPQLNDTFFGANFPGTSIWNANTPIHEDCLYLNVWTPFGVANSTIATRLSAKDNEPRQFKPIPSQHSSQYHSAGSSQPKRPVLVWIFGGGFTSGTSSLSLYEGGLMAGEEDIIVVSMNYRVAALGFLYLGRPEAPGNAGLFDQVMALQWISENIEQFGGDPKRVTLFGESAGAVSASLHLLSPLSRNLFQQAILQSASATAPWALKDTREILLNGLQLATHLGCRGLANEDLSKINRSFTHSELDHVLECMLRVDANELVKYEVGQSRTILKFPFVPVVDGSFLVESPIESLIKQNFKPARLLLGSNGDEGNYWLIYLSEMHHCSYQKQQQQQQQIPQPSSLPSNNVVNSDQMMQYDENNNNRRSRRHNLVKQQESLEDQQRQSDGPEQQPLGAIDAAAADHRLNYNNNPNDISFKYGICKPNEQTISRELFHKLLQREEINPHLKYPIARDAILFEYTNWINPNDSLANNDALDKIFGDFQFSCPVQDFAIRYSSAGNPVYMYHYKHRSSISAWPKWMGVLHGDEINFIFGEPLNSAFNYTPQEVEFSKRMMKYWANFAKSGNPTMLAPNVSYRSDDEWPEYSDKKEYKELSAAAMGTPRIGQGPRAKQCAFWYYHLPRLLETFERSNNCSDPNRPKMLPVDLHDLYFSPYTISSSSAYTSRNKFFSSNSSSILISLIVISALIGIIILVAKQQNWPFINPLLAFLGIQNDESPPTSTSNPSQANNPNTGIERQDDDQPSSTKRRINNNREESDHNTN